MALTGKTVAEVYKDLLTVNSTGNDNQGLESTRKTIMDGEGISSALKLGTDTLEFTGEIQNDMTLHYDVENEKGAFIMSESDGNLKWKIIDAPSGLSRVSANKFDTVKPDNTGAENIIQRTSTNTIIQNVTHIKMKNASYDSGTTTEVMNLDSNGDLIFQRPIQTKEALTFKAAGYDDLQLSATNADFGKAGDKGKMKFEDDKVSMRKGTKDLLVARDDGTTRLQEITDFPTTDVKAGDMVNKSGTVYINT